MNFRRMPGLIALLAVCSLPLSAQETRRTRINPSHNPADDTKPNSNAVPEAYALTGHFDRIVVIRLKNGSNLLDGMERVVREQKIQNGVILSGIGSLRGYELHQVSNRQLPVQETFESDPNQPCDVVSMNGYIIDGRVHAHMTIATPDRVMAGHVEKGNEVYTFAMVTIGVLKDTDLAHVDDMGNR
jgi:predicted DNA-binding protein with PD1-like motif